MQWSPTTLSCPTCTYAISRQPLPIRVIPPPPTVPREIVTHSRNVLSSPSVTPVASPLYLRSCGPTPTQANGEKRFLAPTAKCPSRTTCEISSHSSPSTTCSPTVHHGPIVHD